MIRSLTTVAVLAACAAATPAFAQDAAGYGRWSFGLGAETDNRSKEASKSNGEASVWGTAEWESADGFLYVSPAFDTIDSIGSNLEVQLSAGIRPQVAGFDLDLSATHKWYVDANPGSDDDAWEFTGDVRRSIGPAKARLRVQYSPDSTGASKAWTWVEGRIGWDFTPRLSGTASIGRREQETSVDYTGWNVGMTYDLTDHLEFDLRWHDTDADVPGEQYKGALVAGIAVYF